jgi:hypothetical protein
VVFHVAQESAAPVAGEAFVAAQLAAARSVFAGLLELEDGGRMALPPGHARLVSRRDRDLLGAYLRPAAVNCMVVGALLDVDEPGRVRRGVHWRVRAQPSRHFVIVSAISGPYVLAHELGHFFGHAAHSSVRDNLMSYDQSGAVPFLDPVQRAGMSATAARMRASGELGPR